MVETSRTKALLMSRFFLRILPFLLVLPQSGWSGEPGNWSAACNASIQGGQNFVTLYEIEKRLRKNEFETARDLEQYFSYFGPRFVELFQRIEKLKGQVYRWVDMGAGEGMALRGAKRRLKDVILDAIAVGFKFEVMKKVKMSEAGIRVLEGPVEDLDPTQMGKVDLLTDLFGPFSYSPNIRGVLSQYHQVTNVNSDLFLVVAQIKSPEELSKFRHRPPSSGFRVEDLNGNSIGLEGLFKQVKGFELVQIETVPIERSENASNEVMRIHLKRTSDDFSMPRMKLVGLSSNRPPLMDWKFLKP